MFLLYVFIENAFDLEIYYYYIFAKHVRNYIKIV